MVPSDGSRFRMSMRMVYDFATLKRIFGMSSVTSLSIIGKIAFSITSRFIAGARVCKTISPCKTANKKNKAYRDGETGGHPVEVIRVFAHDCNFRNDSFACPINTKDFSELLQVFSGSFSY